MRNNLFAVFFMAVALSGVPALAQEKTPVKTPHVEMLDEAVIGTLEKSTAPTDQHQLLSGLEGNWYYDLKYWGKDGADPQTSSGTMVNKMAVGGLFLQSETTLILNIGGQNISYKGLGMLGYDTAKKAYTSVWSDSMHSGIVTGSGAYDETLNTIEVKGVFNNPLIGKERNYRSVLRFPEDGIYTQSIFIAGDSGKEFKAVEMTFERR